MGEKRRDVANLDEYNNLRFHTLPRWSIYQMYALHWLTTGASNFQALKLNSDFKLDIFTHKLSLTIEFHSRKCRR